MGQARHWWGLRRVASRIRIVYIGVHRKATLGIRAGRLGLESGEAKGEVMPIPPLDGTIRVSSALGVNLVSYGQGGSDLAQLRGDLGALGAPGRGAYVAKSRISAELRPIRTVVGGASRVVGR